MSERSERLGYWQQLVAEWEASGLSRAAFCRRRRLNYHTMTYWRKRLKQTNGQQRSRVEVTSDRQQRSRVEVTSDRQPPFVEVSLPAVMASATYEVVLGNGRSIRLGTAFDAETVSRLVRTLESC